MRTSLSFRDKYLEDGFVQATQSFHLISFRALTVSFIIQSSAIYFSNPLGLTIFDYSKLFPFIVAMLITVSFYLLVTKKFVRQCSLALPVCVLLYVLGVSEFVNHLQKELPLDSWIYFLVGIKIQTGSLFLLVSRIKWVHCLIIISIINIFPWIRIINAFSSRGAGKTAIFSLIINIFLLISITYLNEKKDRTSFQLLSNQKKQLQTLEELINNVIPTAIIIIKGEEALFVNEAAKNLLDIHDQNQATEIFKQIKVTLHEKKNNFSNSIRIGRDLDNTLLKFVNNYENTALKRKSDLYQSFSCVEGEIEKKYADPPVSFNCQVGPILWKEKLSVIVTLSDISYIKNHYKSLDIHKDNLLATVSHDLRTPLNGMLGMLELLLEEIEDKSQIEKLSVTMSSAKLLLSMINDILDFSLISKGRLRLKFESTNVSSLVEETIKILKLQAKLKGLDLEFNNMLLIKDKIYIIDGNRVKQVLLNLIGNAIKFTESGKISIRLKEEANDDSGYMSRDEIFLTNKHFHDHDYEDVIEEKLNIKSLEMKKSLLFEVEDTGIGIKESEVGKLFKLFSRINPGEGQENSGIGLGLAISQSLVCLMNSNTPDAKISVNSVFGKGSKFFFPILLERNESIIFKEIPGFDLKIPLSLEAKTFNTLNLKDLSPNSHMASEGDSFVASGKRHPQTNVLVVDDDQINLLVAKSYLNSFADDYLVFTAKHGKEALDKVFEYAKNNFYFDIILMDCNMPVMDGYEASEKLKSMMKSNFMPNTPIVAITANVANNDKEKCLAHGMDFFLTKPYTKDQLLKTMKKALNNTR